MGPGAPPQLCSRTSCLDCILFFQRSSHRPMAQLVHHRRHPLGITILGQQQFQRIHIRQQVPQLQRLPKTSTPLHPIHPTKGSTQTLVIRQQIGTTTIVIPAKAGTGALPSSPPLIAQRPKILPKTSKMIHKIKHQHISILIASHPIIPDIYPFGNHKKPFPIVVIIS